VDAAGPRRAARTSQPNSAASRRSSVPTTRPPAPSWNGWWVCSPRA